MDLHDRFADWLTAGAEGEPPRDLALHASGCDACLRSVAALDSLLAIDIGDAPLPPLRVVAEDTDRIPRMLRYAVGAVAVVLLGTSVVIGASGLLRPAQAGPATDLPSPREDELAGEPTTTGTPELATVAPIESGTPVPTPTPSASETVVTDATAAPQPPPPRTAAPQPPGTPQPTAPAPPQPPPQPTPTPTPVVTVEPSPSPSSAEPTSSASASPSMSLPVSPPSLP